jgi:hypothetical protein
MKRNTTNKGSITSNKKLKEAWIKCWLDMLQTKIQAWIERIMIHIQDIIRLEGVTALVKGGRTEATLH